jgi:hypothetical protein
MTTRSSKRCSHCGEPYIYTGSGAGCMDPTNSETYCPGCKTVHDEALRKAFGDVPRHFEMRYQNVSEIPALSWVTLNHVLAWESAPGVQPMARRIWVGLHDLKTGDSQNVREVVPHTDHAAINGLKFKVSTWRQDPDHSIEVQREYDLVEGRFTGHPWPR